MIFKKLTEDSGKKRKITFSEMPSVNVKIAHISSLKFSGHYSESANGEFWIACSDTYVLKKNVCYFGQDNQILVSGEGQNPEYGKVANNGTFIINNRLKNGLGNTFYVIDKDGNTLIQHRFEERIWNNGLSEDGNFAVCDCAGFLYFFDLDSRSLQWKIRPKCRRRFYLFDTEKKHLHLKDLDERSYRYDFEGNFIDKEKWEEERVTYATPVELYLLAKERFTAVVNPVSPDKADEVLSLLNRALTAKEIDRQPQYKALTYRLLGEVYESQNDIDQAIGSFEWALQFDPKVGVKQKLNKLKKL